MKVGILTIHHAINYGAVLQAWSLQQAIQRMGHEAEVIDYRPPEAVAEYRKDWSRSWPARLRLLKAARFERFLQRELPTRPGITRNADALRRLEGEHDALVCGSDQIWCLDSFRGFDPNFFLEFAEAWRCRRISYAPSFGDTTVITDTPTHDRIQRSLRGFSALSVRDTNSRRLAVDTMDKPGSERQTTERPEVEYVLDPTFLADFSPLLDGQRRGRRKPYLLVYADVGQAERAWIRGLAQTRGLEIVAVSGRFAGADRAEYLAGPHRWLALFRDAAYIVTNFFHGTVFALIFGKEFVVLGRDSKRIKTMDLLRSFGLEDRWIERTGEVGAFSREPAECAETRLDDESLSSRRTERVEASRDFLRRALQP